MPRPKPAEEPVQIALRLSPAQIVRIDAEAERSKRSRNGVIADAITFHLTDREGQMVREAFPAKTFTTKDAARFRGVQDDAG